MERRLFPDEAQEDVPRVTKRWRSPDQQAEYDRCATDPVYWFRTYVWTYNPKLKAGSRWLRFELFPKQAEFIGWLQDRQSMSEEGLVEKSRDVGLSWLCIGYLVHQWLFTDDFKGAVGSRKEDLVDRKGDPDSLMEKARLLLRRLPEWMQPAGYDERKHAGFLKFINPENGSTITGEAGDNIGRGGRNSIYILDEAAFLEHAERVEAALSNNCDVVIWVSTVNGVGNTFWKKRFGKACKVFVFDWRDDPRKDQIWYDAQVAKFAHDPSIVAAEVDRDYTASVQGVLIPGKWIQAAVDAETKLSMPRSGSTQAAADIAAGGANLTVFGGRTGAVVHSLQSWEEENTTLNAHKLAAESRAIRASWLHYDANGIGIACKSTFALTPNLGFKTDGILGGASPTERVWPDDRTSKELFHNYRAELAWGLRERFRKTYEMVTGVADHPLDELISIPLHADLCAQLSMPLQKWTATGKRLVESKEDMRARGVVSPDWFDFCMYLFAPEPDPPLAPVHLPTTQLESNDYSVFGFDLNGTTYEEAY